MRAMNRYSMILALTLMVAATACGNAAGSSQPASTQPTPATATTPIADGTTVPATNDDKSGSAYATKAFNIPFDVTLPGWLDATPSVEQPNFVTWQSPTVHRAVRVLVPVTIYPPDGTGPTSPPADYLDYLLAQTDRGAHFTDQTKATVGDKPATIVTATVDDSLDGSLGCPDNTTAAHDCFGLQPEVVLRIAVVDTGTTPLLIWLRGDIGTDMTTANESFAELLASIHFRDRPVQAPATTTTAALAATPLDGTYRWTITAADALTYGTPGDKTPENQATFPWIFTVTMNDGHWTMKHRQADGDFDDGEGTYTVQGDRVVLDSVGGIVDTFAFEVDGEGTLHLTGQGGSDPGDVFVMATNPWTKIAGGVAAPTSVDGTYRWTLTKDDALTHGLPGDRTPQAQATFPSVFTMTMDRGTWQLGNLDAQGVANSDAGHGSYSVEGDHVVFHEGVEVFDYTFSIDADGTVHLVAQPPINPGPAWVFTTNPWTKIT